MDRELFLETLGLGRSASVDGMVNGVADLFRAAPLEL
jgi:hypothetical protein